jgi:hypothetical protein
VTDLAGPAATGAEGIGRGLRRAADAELPRDDIEADAQALVYGALDRYRGRQVTHDQVELFAEFVTLALAAGVTPKHLQSWVKDLCGDWG